MLGGYDEAAALAEVRKLVLDQLTFFGEHGPLILGNLGGSRHDFLLWLKVASAATGGRGQVHFILVTMRSGALDHLLVVRIFRFDIRLVALLWRDVFARAVTAYFVLGLS